MSIGELASTYACLILSDDGIPITADFDFNQWIGRNQFETGFCVMCMSRWIFCVFVLAEKIATILKAANVECESYWPSLFAKLAEKKNIEDLIVNVGAGGGGGAPAVAAAPAAGGAAAAAPAAEEKKEEEPKEDTDDDMGFSLFD
ncbi:putative ribosomal protein P1/P2 [Helianthus annuus]|nr:putative ribosomal protein P1/P2 [Helianthus annuus]